MAFKNIIVCSDFSENSNKAFDVAAQMAGDADAKLTVLHVVATSYDYEDNPAVSQSHVASVYGEKAAKRMEELYGSKRQVETATEFGNEAQKILQYSQDHDADLIVMGARGIGWVQGLLGGGSIVNKVIKASPIPVLVVPAG